MWLSILGGALFKFWVALIMVSLVSDEGEKEKKKLRLASTMWPSAHQLRHIHYTRVFVCFCN